MIIKVIKVHVRPGHMEAFLESQRIWDRKTRASPGFRGAAVGVDDAEPDVVHVHVYWESREALEAFMADEHDRIAALARSMDHYERLEIARLHSVRLTPAPSGRFPIAFSPDETSA